METNSRCASRSTAGPEVPAIDPCSLAAKVVSHVERVKLIRNRKTGKCLDYGTNRKAGPQNGRRSQRLFSLNHIRWARWGSQRTLVVVNIALESITSSFITVPQY